MQEKQTEPEDKVKLSPFMGIRPGVYFTVLYSAILLAILFWLLFLPGLKNPGAVLLVKTEPMGAAIRVDDAYMGVSGNKIFLPKGTYTIEAVMPGFETESAVHKIPGRVFGSRFFPIRYNIEFTLKTNDPAAAFAQAAADYAAWSFAGEPTAIWQIPLSLSEGAYRAGATNDPAMAEILQAASRFAVTRAALRDLIRAKMLLDNKGLSPSPASVANSVSGILTFLSENPNSAQWLAELLPPESASIVKASNWYKRNQIDVTTVDLTSPPSGQRFNVAGLSFIESAGFSISEEPVTRSLYETFLNENPEWKTETIFPSEFYNTNTITDISWYAAEAFCEWLTKRLPASMANMEIRLPTELEWGFSVYHQIIKLPDSGWEWCADPYAPLDFSASERAIQAAGSPERSLRGRANPLAQTGRTSLPPDISSPFVTFRPVIVNRHE